MCKKECFDKAIANLELAKSFSWFFLSLFLFPLPLEGKDFAWIQVSKIKLRHLAIQSLVEEAKN